MLPTEEMDSLILKIYSFIYKNDYRNALSLLQRLSFITLTEDISKEYTDTYEKLKKNILGRLHISEYYFPAIVKKRIHADFMMRISEDFQENANEKDILLSVFLVTFNQEKTIAKCIESVIHQETQYKYKIFILEDCSTDSTLNICKEYEYKYPELIEVIAQPSNTFNNEERHFRTALRTRLNTPYWTAVEGDDFWVDSKKIQAALTFLENNTEYVGIGSNWIYNDLNTHEKYLGIRPENFNKSTFTIDDYFYLHTSTRFYRNIINFSTIPLSKKMGDAFIYFAFLLNGPFYYYNKVTSVYNLGTGIWSTLPEDEQRKKSSEVQQEFISRAQEKLAYATQQQECLEKYLQNYEGTNKKNILRQFSRISYYLRKTGKAIFLTLKSIYEKVHMLINIQKYKHYIKQFIKKIINKK